MAKTLHELSKCQFDLLKQEIELIDKAIARIDHIQLSMKNWAIVVWGGSLYLIVEHINRSGMLILLTAIIPFLFGYMDLIWRQQLLKVNYRQNRISAFINGSTTEEDFKILDPLGRAYEHTVLKADFKKETSLFKAIGYKGEGFFYLVLILISILLAALK